MRSIFRNFLFVTFVTMLFCNSSWGAGLWVLEMANPDIGTASAGRGATAADASVAMFNPAGMTKLDRSQLFTGIQGSWLNVKFDVDESTFGAETAGMPGISYRRAVWRMFTVSIPNSSWAYPRRHFSVWE